MGCFVGSLLLPQAPGPGELTFFRIIPSAIVQSDSSGISTVAPLKEELRKGHLRRVPVSLPDAFCLDGLLMILGVSSIQAAKLSTTGFHEIIFGIPFFLSECRSGWVIGLPSWGGSSPEV